MTSKLSTTVRVLFLLVIVLCPLGCATSTSTSPGSSIELRVYRILRVGEFPSDLANEGCRLSDEEIEDAMLQLLSSSKSFGTNVQFVWSGAIQDVRLSGLDRLTTTYPAQLNSLLAQPSFLPDANPSAISIYFMGHTFLSSPTELRLGVTRDPDLADGTVFAPGFILLADGGFDSAFGFGDWSNSLLRRTPQHEMAHYLARFNSRTFGSGPSARTYDSAEHVSSGANILITGAVVPLGAARVTTVPGRSAMPPSGSGGEDELGEISRRIYRGRWNRP